jgi:uncharacterized protein (DUF1778 family)
MAHIALENNSRVAMRIRPEDKAKLMRAGALQQTDLTDFILRSALLAAEAVIGNAERVRLTENDSLRVLALLANPPVPNAKLLSAAQRLPPE